jgi:hypothetical protein
MNDDKEQARTLCRPGNGGARRGFALTSAPSVGTARRLRWSIPTSTKKLSWVDRLAAASRANPSSRSVGQIRPHRRALDASICALNVREGQENTFYGSEGRFFPHLPNKHLISHVSATIPVTPCQGQKQGENRSFQDRIFGKSPVIRGSWAKIRPRTQAGPITGR